MLVTPGNLIPFWFRLWDGNASRHVVAHLTDAFGNAQAGSPYPLTYTNRGIYVGSGPEMGTINLVADYETYLDSGFTQLDPSYLPAAEWIQPDVGPPPQLILLNRPLLGTVSPSQLAGSISCEVEALAAIQRDQLIGSVTTPLLTGSVNSPEIQEFL